MLNRVRLFFAPPPPVDRLPAKDVQKIYPRYRLRIMEATFIGYGTFYLLRKGNFSTISKEMGEALHYEEASIGMMMAVASISYGIAKFLMGSVSDRSDPRKFMAAGLLMSACCNLSFGFVANYYVHMALWVTNGFVQGMGWPPCGRSMGHWFSESERGLTFSIWNTSHNLGGAIAGVLAAKAALAFGGWQYAFIVPGIICAFGSLYIYWRLRDTPQSVGLPPVEEYRNDYGSEEQPGQTLERELSFKELFLDKVILNKFIWLLAAANFFAYIARYSMVSWGPTYLKSMKGAAIDDGGWAIFAIEFGGIPSTIFLGWISDRAGGRRGMVASLCMIPIFLAFLGIMNLPQGHLNIDMTLLATIGFFIYPVINLITIAALDSVSKKAIGTAAGFIGFAGYLGAAAQEAGFGWVVQHYSQRYSPAAAWDIVFYVILASAVIAGVLLALTWNARPKR